MGLKLRIDQIKDDRNGEQQETHKISARLVAYGGMVKGRKKQHDKKIRHELEKRGKAERQVVQVIAVLGIEEETEDPAIRNFRMGETVYSLRTDPLAGDDAAKLIWGTTGVILEGREYSVYDK